MPTTEERASTRPHPLAAIVFLLFAGHSDVGIHGSSRVLNSGRAGLVCRCAPFFHADSATTRTARDAAPSRNRPELRAREPAHLPRNFPWSGLRRGFPDRQNTDRYFGNETLDGRLAGDACAAGGWPSVCSRFVTSAERSAGVGCVCVRRSYSGLPRFLVRPLSGELTSSRAGGVC